MGRPRKHAKTHNIKVTHRAHEAARVASGFTGESLVDYVSRVLEAKGNEDIDIHIAKRAEERAQPEG